MRPPRISNANAADRPAFKVQMHLECRLLAAFRVQVQTFGHALGSAIECAFALCVLWPHSHRTRYTHTTAPPHRACAFSALSRVRTGTGVPPPDHKPIGARPWARSSSLPASSSLQSCSIASARGKVRQRGEAARYFSRCEFPTPAECRTASIRLTPTPKEQLVSTDSKEEVAFASLELLRQRGPTRHMVSLLTNESTSR